MSDGAAKTPAEFVTTVRASPCVPLEITTFALGTTEPEGSCTVPEMAATPPDCANAVAPANTNSGASNFQFISFSLLNPLPRPREVHTNL